LQPEPAFKERWPHLSVNERAGLVRKVFLFVEYEARLHALATAHPAIQSILRRLVAKTCGSFRTWRS
jgi:hypothetical protein